MGSCNRVNGTCAHENAHLLTGILRSEWGVDGMAVSGWGGSNGAVDAARAGGPLEKPGPGPHGARQIVAAALRVPHKDPVCAWSTPSMGPGGEAFASMGSPFVEHRLDGPRGRGLRRCRHH